MLVDAESSRLSLKLLNEADAAELDALYRRGEDYIQLAEGHGAVPGTAQLAFEDAPAGYSKNIIKVIGLRTGAGQLIGVLQLLIGYPEPQTWWIGLALIDPDWRSLGIGRQLIDWLLSEASRNGVRELSLGVFDENVDGLRFWVREGFTETSMTESQPFGFKMHAVHFLKRVL